MVLNLFSEPKRKSKKRGNERYDYDRIKEGSDQGLPVKSAKGLSAGDIVIISEGVVEKGRIGARGEWPTQFITVLIKSNDRDLDGKRSESLGACGVSEYDQSVVCVEAQIPVILSVIHPKMAGDNLRIDDIKFSIDRSLSPMMEELSNPKIKEVLFLDEGQIVAYLDTFSAKDEIKDSIYKIHDIYGVK